MKARQTKDVADVDVVRAIVALGPPASLYALRDRLALPPRLVANKLDSMIRRGLVDGCACGCRGDFVLTDAGRALCS